MDRKETRILKDDNTEECKVVVRFDPSRADAKSQYFVMQHLAENPVITHCSGRLFERMVIYYDGERYVAEMRAAVPRLHENPAKNPA